MKKLLFALAMLVMGAFAFTTGTPAKAMTAGAVTGMADIVKPSDLTENVGYYHRRHYHRRHYRSWCWYNPYSWRCRHRHHHRRHYRPWWY